MELNRSFGILLHPTCFPGQWGIGVLGSGARVFLDWLQKAGASWWQVLPLGPTTYGDSPYQARSSFAGNPFLIDPDELITRGWLTDEQASGTSSHHVDFGWIYKNKWPLLRRAYKGFLRIATHKDQDEVNRFRECENYWIEDYALFCSLRTKYNNCNWSNWPQGLKKRARLSMDQARLDLASDIDFHVWTQWVFFQQWGEIRSYARARGIHIIGDIPIFVAHDSPEVWAHPEMFLLDKKGLPSVVAGVPPDYFSSTGQLWGNPLYDWDALRADNFSWWIKRLCTVLRTCDLVRVDHFRGFEAYWEVPAGSPNAVNGRWVKAPAKALFAAIQKSLGHLPIIAEDLGVITPEVEALRDEMGLPGIKVLQFGFNDNKPNDFLLHKHPKHGNFVVYPGTHDNETTLGWYRNLEPLLRANVQNYLLNYDLPFMPDTELPWSFIQLTMLSPGRVAIIPLQDVLALDNEARMNAPATSSGNWAWRYDANVLTDALALRLWKYAKKNNRLSNR